MIPYIKERHEYWWNYLLERVWVPENFKSAIPETRFVTKKSRIAGSASSMYCEYNLLYAMEQGEEFDETICHEICHTFAKRIKLHEGHGSFWEYLYQVVCGVKRGKYHYYKKPNEDTIAAAKAIRKLLKLKAQMKD